MFDMNTEAATDQAIVLAMSEIRGVCRPIELAQVLDEIRTSPSAEIGEVHDGPAGGTLDELFAKVTPERVTYWERELSRLGNAGVTVTTVCDESYPINLRMVFNRPAYLFASGRVVDADQYAVAVVGTRKPSDFGLRIATDVAAGLAAEGVTVVSGLALGIDIAAHASALNSGGRTIAVLGSGIEKVSPAGHRSVANRIAADERGAVVSQFPPSTPPQRWTFPLRNVVTSGLSAATVVIEAGPTSGARLQAENCLQHGKKLLLVEKLVMQQPWAREMVDRPGVAVVSDVGEIIDFAVAETAVPVEIG